MTENRQPGVGDLLNKLGAAALEAKELIRELHGLHKDLRADMREVERLTAGLKEAVEATIDEDIEALITASADRHLTDLNILVKDADRRIIKHFEDLVRPMFARLDQLAAILHNRDLDLPETPLMRPPSALEVVDALLARTSELVDE